jgi:hypothetical protein
MDPRTIVADEWKDRESDGILVVPNAGEMLYRAADVSWPLMPAAGPRQTLPEEVTRNRPR